MTKIKDLPSPLKIVAFANIVVIAVSTIMTVLEFSQSTTQDLVVSGVSIFLTILIVLGILEKSKFIRTLALIFSGLATAMGLLSLPFVIASTGIESLWIVYSLAVSVVTIWGLMTKETKLYYGITKETK